MNRPSSFASSSSAFCIGCSPDGSSRASRLDITFLLNPERARHPKGGTKTNAVQLSALADAHRHAAEYDFRHRHVYGYSTDIEDELNSPLSPQDTRGSQSTQRGKHSCSLHHAGGYAYRYASPSKAAHHHGNRTDIKPRHISTGESPDHEEPLAGNEHEDGRECGSNRRGYRFLKRKRRAQVKTNLQQRRGIMAARAEALDFMDRECCKRLRCFRRADDERLRAAVRDTMLMTQLQRKQTLAGWLRDGSFVFDGDRVCSAFLANAFGFSRDLQRSVKTAAAAAGHRYGGDFEGRSASRVAPTRRWEAH